jgi:hypothetical protein
MAEIIGIARFERKIGECSNFGTFYVKVTVRNDESPSAIIIEIRNTESIEIFVFGTINLEENVIQRLLEEVSQKIVSKKIEEDNILCVFGFSELESSFTYGTILTVSEDTLRRASFNLKKSLAHRMRKLARIVLVDSGEPDFIMEKIPF